MAFGQTPGTGELKSKPDSYSERASIICPMKHVKVLILLFVMLMFVVSGILLVSCKDKSMKGMIVFTQVPEYSQYKNYQTGDSWRYVPQARIVALYPDKPTSFRLLTGDFYSARSPEISYDGRFIIFAGQLKQNGLWQIWELEFESMEKRQVTYFQESCIDPAFLPGGRIVFSKSMAFDSTGAGHALHTCNLDGTDVRRITFHPNADFTPTVLSDGRILTISSQIYPEKECPMLMVLRTDGTKYDLYYKDETDELICTRPWESERGNIYFIRSNPVKGETGSIFTIHRNRPLHTCIKLNNEINGSFNAVTPLKSGKLLVSYRSSENDRYVLHEFDTGTGQLGKLIYEDPKYSSMEAVVVEAHQQPRNLPSEVDLQVKTGLLMCQDINIMDEQSMNAVHSQKKASQIEVLGLDASLGIMNVKEDGSFYLKAMADKPFRIRTLDKNGKVISEPCTWIWLRPNERRGCIGCHEDHELVPENRMPLAVKKSPVIIPRHITLAGEKEIELE